jgi:hypothetical protein
MAEIVRVHHPDVVKKLLEQCLQKFYWIRGLEGMRKRPSTSELIDWIGALIQAGIPPNQVAKEIPFLGTLVKRKEDLDVVDQGGDRMSAMRNRGQWR